MKLPLSWLKEFVSIEGISTKEYASLMTMTGSKVEGVEYLGEEIQNVITGKVLSVEKHPDSDHLVICQLNVGQEDPIQIVTGAENVTPGCIVPVAMHKSLLPGGVKITKGKLRGVPSNGMMCSFQELGLTIHNVPYADENGILLLPPETPIGADIRQVLGLDEHVVEFEITSNRPDCLSVIGLARETAATFGREMKLHEPEVKGAGDAVENYLSVTVKEPELCPRYTAKIVKNIKIAPSPAWMRERLHAAGVRPINNIVDITNYIMLEYGQPMHAFDYACLSDAHIVVRHPAAGETIETLDEQPRNLTPDMLAICDGVKPVAVAGVMGGANSEITDKTKIVVFESANFNGPSVRITAKKLGMRTESSGRFEKGLDAQMTEKALMRACELVELLGAGEVVDGIIDVNNASLDERTLPLEPERINALLGLSVPTDEMVKILEKLDFKVNNGVISIPSFRGDIQRMCDVAEEIARFYGYDRIPTTLFAGDAVLGALTEQQKFERRLMGLCRTAGFDEAMTHSFISPKMYDRIGLSENDAKRVSVTITNPLGEDFSVMRTTALPSMLDTLAHNYSYRNPEASLYELATVYTPIIKDRKADAEKLPEESRILMLGSYGRLSFFQFKGVIELILKEFDLPDVSFEAVSDNPSYHPGRCARICAGDKEIGIFGAIHPSVSKLNGMEVEVLSAEISCQALYSLRNTKKLYTPLPRFPASTRDIAFLVDAGIPVAKLEKEIRGAVGNILESVSLFDVYCGDQIPDGKKSVAYSVTMRVSDRTLTDEECDKAVKKAIASLETSFAAILRS